VQFPAPSEPPVNASPPHARTGRQSAHSAPPPPPVLRRRTHPTSRPKPPRSKRTSPARRTSPQSGGTASPPPRSSVARSQPPLLDKHTPCANRPTCLPSAAGKRVFRAEPQETGLDCSRGCQAQAQVEAAFARSHAWPVRCRRHLAVAGRRDRSQRQHGPRRCPARARSGPRRRVGSQVDRAAKDEEAESFPSLKRPTASDSARQRPRRRG
jgi:hypothetical protein